MTNLSDRAAQKVRHLPFPIPMRLKHAGVVLFSRHKLWNEDRGITV
jgi:hypothetical protein